MGYDTGGVDGICPTPHGVGGLKFFVFIGVPPLRRSHPSRGGWIEIDVFAGWLPPAGSHPSRGGWIEMVSVISITSFQGVPPLTGWVD